MINLASGNCSGLRGVITGRAMDDRRDRDVDLGRLTAARPGACPEYRLFVVLSDQICPDLSKALGRPIPTRPLTMISGSSGTSGHRTRSMEGVQGFRTLGRS